MMTMVATQIFQVQFQRRQSCRVCKRRRSQQASSTARDGPRRRRSGCSPICVVAWTGSANSLFFLLLLTPCLPVLSSRVAIARCPCWSCRSVCCTLARPSQSIMSSWSRWWNVIFICSRPQRLSGWSSRILGDPGIYCFVSLASMNLKRTCD